MNYLNINGLSLLNESKSNKIDTKYKIGQVFHAINNDVVNDFVVKYNKYIKYIILSHKPSFLISIIDESFIEEINDEIESNINFKISKNNNIGYILDLLNSEYDYLYNINNDINLEISPKCADALSSIFNSVNKIVNFLNNDKISFQAESGNLLDRSKSSKFINNIQSKFDKFHENSRNRVLSMLKKTANDNVKSLDDYDNKLNTLLSLNTYSYAKLGMESKKGIDVLNKSAEKNNINYSESINKEFRLIHSKIELFKNAGVDELPDKESIILRAYSISALLNKYKAAFNEDSFKALDDLILQITSTKCEILEKSNEISESDTEVDTQVDTSTDKDVKSLTKYITSDQFEYDIAIRLHIGELITINAKDLKGKEDITSWMSKISKASHELFGYEPQGYIVSTIDSYQGVRDFGASVVQAGAGSIAGNLGRIIGKKEEGKQRGQDIGRWLREELMQKPGDVNSKIVELEENIRNLDTVVPNWFRSDNNKIPNKRTIIDKPISMEKEQSSKIKKQNKKIIGENFDGGGNVGGGFYTQPGSQSMMGDPVAPTSDQTPFVDGNKTTTSNSGSGDKFSPNVKKKDNTMSKLEELLNRMKKS